MSAMRKRSFASADEVRRFDCGVLEVVTLGGVTFGRAILQPGWKWSTSKVYACITRVRWSIGVSAWSRTLMPRPTKSPNRFCVFGDFIWQVALMPLPVAG